MPTPLKPNSPATEELECIRALRSEQERATQQRRQEELEGIAAQAATTPRPTWVSQFTAQQRREIKRDAMAVAIALPVLLVLVLLIGFFMAGLMVVLYTP